MKNQRQVKKDLMPRRAGDPKCSPGGATSAARTVEEPARQACKGTVGLATSYGRGTY
jgi:hypothetical protein